MNDRITLAAVGCALLLAAPSWLGCSGKAVIPPPEEAHSVASPYVIGASDVLSVRVWKNPELSVDVPVRPDGMISVPLLDDIHAAGLTAEELRDLVARELEEFVGNPDVTVVVTQTYSKRIYVIGEVGRSGPLGLATDTRVTDALAQAGGFSPFANKKKIKIIRRVEGGGENEYTFNYDAYVKGKAPGTNVILRPGDTVVVSD